MKNVLFAAILFLPSTLAAQSTHFVNDVTTTMFDTDGDVLKCLVVAGFDTPGESDGYRFHWYGKNHNGFEMPIKVDAGTKTPIGFFGGKYWYSFESTYTPPWFDYGIGRLPEYSRYEIDWQSPDSPQYYGFAFNHGSWLWGDL